MCLTRGPLVVEWGWCIDDPSMYNPVLAPLLALIDECEARNRTIGEGWGKCTLEAHVAYHFCSLLGFGRRSANRNLSIINTLRMITMGAAGHRGQFQFDHHWYGGRWPGW